MNLKVEAVKDIVANTYRNITGAIEFLLLKGYERFKQEQSIINGCEGVGIEKQDGCGEDGTHSFILFFTI